MSMPLARLASAFESTLSLPDMLLLDLTQPRLMCSNKDYIALRSVLPHETVCHHI